MKKSFVLILSLLGLIGCQNKDKEEEKEADFEQMVIIQDDRAGQDIGGETQEERKMR